MKTNERLESWLNAADIAKAEMARRVGCDKGNFHRILTGASRPTLDLAARIESETAGAIPISAWAKQKGVDVPAGFLMPSPEHAS
jgi:transcriptional regulator with XRE-family HTH domain